MLREKVLAKYDPLTNYEAFAQEPSEIARRLAVLDRLGTDPRMKTVWTELTRKERDPSLRGTPHTGNPYRGVSEEAYRRHFSSNKAESLPDAEDRLKRARQALIEMAARYVMKPDRILRAESEISIRGLKAKVKEAEALLEAAKKIREVLSSPYRSENWDGIDMTAALKGIVWALEADLKELQSDFYRRVSGNRGTTYARTKVHVIRLYDLVLSLFEEPLQSIVAVMISVATGADLSRQDVESLISQYQERKSKDGDGKKKSQ